MKNKIEDTIKRIKEIEDMVLDTRGVLAKILDYQVSLDVRLQDSERSSQIETIAINSASKIDFIPIDQIVYCKANLAYTDVVSFNNNAVTSTKNINEVEDQINNHSFFRISKSLLINIRQVHSFNKRTNQVLMRNQDLLEVARRRKVEFMSLILNR